MKPFFIFAALIFATTAQSQTSSPVIATATGHRFSVSDLSPEAQDLFSGRKKQIEIARTKLLDQYVSDEIIGLEARAKNTTPERLVEAELRKVPSPTAAQIKAIYDANLSSLGGRTISEVTPDIVAFLRRDPEQKAFDAFISSLKTKYKVTMGKSVNDAGIKPADIVSTINGKPVTAETFNSKYRIIFNDIEHEQYEDIRADLEAAVLNALIADEAKSRDTDASGIIASEITDKMRTFEDGEREELESSLMKRLFAKYQVKLLLNEPEVISQNISVDDDPSRGPATAPVTVIMFSDFQCPACARTHPILKKVLAEYGEKVRFVVRDYPLQKLHKNAFAAAMAADAADLQGKFFEYTEILYRNQDALDSESLKKYAAQAGLNVKQFEIDLSLERSAAEIRKDIEDGDSYGVSGTPTIFVNGAKVHRLSAESFRLAIDRALAK